MAQRIAIVDYGMGNLRSVQKALAHVAPGLDDEGSRPRADRQVDAHRAKQPQLRRNGVPSALCVACIERLP